jgi:hypothetical protein
VSAEGSQPLEERVTHLQDCHPPIYQLKKLKLIHHHHYKKIGTNSTKL